MIFYDVNGNMVEDKNKGITVVYNYLNLPIQVNFGPNDRIDWTYTATGAKLQKKVYTNGSLTLTQDYVSGFVYKNGSLDFFSTETGRVKNQSGNLKYQYTLTDHLGNTRVMFEETSGTPTVIEESHYYAFGMRIEGLSTTNPDNKFTYNGKELEDDHGLNWYHYGARFYDAQIGRWHVTDLVDELLSPYAFAANNPIVVKDENGMWNEYVVRAAMLIINDGTKKYGNIYPADRLWTDRMSETIEVFRYDLTIQERIGAKQMLCNNFIYTAFRAAGYNIAEDRRPMKEWFRKNGTLFEDKEIPWEKLEAGDVLNTGSYAGMEGHVAMIVSSIVENSNGEKGYMVAHSTRRGSVDGPVVEFLSLEFLQSWLDQAKDSGDFDRWIGRMDTGPWYKPEELMTDE